MNVKKILAGLATPLVAGVMLLGMAVGASAGTYHNPDALQLRTYNTVSTASGYEPHTLYLMRGGPTVWVSHMHWTSWTHNSARGTGYLYGSDMTTEYLGHVTIVLSRPTSNCHHHGAYFYSLRIIGGNGIMHYWHWSWSLSNLGWTT